MRKLLTCLIAAVSLFATPAFAKAEHPVRVAVDGEIISFPINKDVLRADIYN